MSNRQQLEHEYLAIRNINFNTRHRKHFSKRLAFNVIQKVEETEHKTGQSANLDLCMYTLTITHLN